MRPPLLVLLPLLPLVIVLSWTAEAVAKARGPVAGPVSVEVVRVVDGDTFVADAHVWPGHVVRVSVRVRGIDAPEGRSRCEAERVAAARAREALAALLVDEAATITNIGGGKYFGRVLADVTTLDGRAVAAELLARSLVRPYAGGRREPFCGGQAQGG